MSNQSIAVPAIIHPPRLESQRSDWKADDRLIDQLGCLLIDGRELATCKTGLSIKRGGLTIHITPKKTGIFFTELTIEVSGDVPTRVEAYPYFEDNLGISHRGQRIEGNKWKIKSHIRSRDEFSGGLLKWKPTAAA